MESSKESKSAEKKVKTRKSQNQQLLLDKQPELESKTSSIPQSANKNKIRSGTTGATSRANIETKPKSSSKRGDTASGQKEISR